MENEEKILFLGGTAEIEEKKSRFIAHTYPVSSETEANAYLTAAKKKYWDARHNCYAMMIGSISRSSDDGEPAGTAGRPILDVLNTAGVHNALIIVTRYFGGTLLGTGGLIRAYRLAAQEGLEASVVLTRRPGHIYTVHTDYSDLGRLQYLLAKHGVFTLESRYDADVHTDLVLADGQAGTLMKAITEATGARARIEKGDAVSFAMHEGRPVFLS